jgi:hypothetical protein
LPDFPVGQFGDEILIMVLCLYPSFTDFVRLNFDKALGAGQCRIQNPVKNFYFMG